MYSPTFLELATFSQGAPRITSGGRTASPKRWGLELVSLLDLKETHDQQGATTGKCCLSL